MASEAFQERLIMNAGFIGVGNMGNPMAANMIKAGHQLTVHDLRRESATNLLEMGAEWADTPAGCVAGKDAVFTSLPVPRDVEAVVMGENGIMSAAGSGDVYVDLSTNSPTVIRRIHDECASRGVTVLDAPVSGGQAHAGRHRNPRGLLRRNRQRHGHQDLQQPAVHGDRCPDG